MINKNSNVLQNVTKILKNDDENQIINNKEVLCTGDTDIDDKINNFPENFEFDIIEENNENIEFIISEEEEEEEVDNDDYECSQYEKVNM